MRRWLRTLAPAALSIASFAALPSLEWCPFRWSDCAAPCDVAVAPSCPESAGGCPMAAARAGDPSCTSSEASCVPDGEPIPVNERAWCIHAPFDGLVVRIVGLEPPDAAALPAILVAAIEVEVLRASTGLRIERSPPSPVLIAAHAPPLSRAPPSA